MSPDFNAHDRLVDVLAKPLGQRVPEPLHERLEQLCDVAYEAGETRRPTKAEMAAAIILGAPTDPVSVVKLLRDLGVATVADALLPSDEPSGDVITLPRRTSGPRSPRGPQPAPSAGPS